VRVLLINPPSPEQTASPLLGQQYVASALQAAGHEVRVIDAAARYFDRDGEWIADEAEDWAPDMVGMGLFTRWVWHAYALAVQLRERGRWTMVAGGAHATVRPDEPLDYGFDVVLRGECEESAVALGEWLAARGTLESIPGIVFTRPDGSVGYGPPPRPVENLDVLAPPWLAQPLFDPGAYDPSGRGVTPGGILTSRGCPARCTFCANYVTGRRFRHRSAASVVGEIQAWHDGWGVSFFPCWDDALTANTRRLKMLGDALATLTFPFSFSAITRANMVTPDLLRHLRRAGLVHINFGVESGDDAILRAIRKGIRTDQVLRALEWSKEEGLRTACNFMLGFPEETPSALERTLRFMERIAPLTDTFSTLGVVVPFPGTPIYENHHRAYGFTDWWLRPDYSRYTPPPPLEETERFYRFYIDDANLELDFFRYGPEMRDLIRTCLRFKAEHNLEAMGVRWTTGTTR
jgi:anaerobic magnesium-protoporphyrin IX monomethyl ester cyclase